METENKKLIAGFTLLEILIAIFIFAVVITTIFGSYHSIFNKNEAITETIRTYETAKNCLSRMIFDLQSIYVPLKPQYRPPGFNDPPYPYRIIGDTYDAGNTSFSRLRFTSFAHIPFGKSPQTGIAEIVYYVQTEDDDRLVLRRSDKMYPYELFEEKRSDPLLCRNIKSLTFKYYDQEGIEYDNWDSESSDFKYATPKAIAIELEIGEDSDSMFFKMIVALPAYRKKIG
ncbi:MAG: prepilin-type N-terminal cleavage/methylation domain-containing protein [Desulfobacterales bacterium]|nr:prepilin-type N-terminal cleavage/methylation domain-containing protein [Desulfobacterales bacterium]